MANLKAFFRNGRLFAVALCLILAAAFMLPALAYAQDVEKTVRVGWFESPFNSVDQFGRRSGYAYEYQQRIAAYTGWTYDYVEGSWPELVQMLENGEIDLMSDVSFTEERASHMLFSTLPMGTEEYYLYVSANNRDIVQEDYSTLNGKRVGVTSGTVQLGFFRAWVAEHGLHPEIVELTGSEVEALQMLRKGELDACVTVGAYEDLDTALPLCEIGSSDFYFAVSNYRPDLLPELNKAMGDIRNENRNYNHELYEQYVEAAGENLFLSADEKKWLSSHGAIRVGYQDNYLAFCAKDETTGELTGALKDYFAAASDCMENAHLDFEPIAYPTAAGAIEALKRGEVDCMFPSNLTDYDGEMQGVVMTPSLMSAEVWAVVRSSDQRDFVRSEQITVAVNEGNLNYDVFLLDHFPSWEAKHYPDTPACLQAVARGEADCILISSCRYSNVAKLCENLHLTPTFTGVNVDYDLALRKGDAELYSILSKTICMVPDSTVSAALTYYSAEDAKTSFVDFIQENLAVVMAVIAVVALAIVVLLLRSMRAEKKADEGQRLISATETDTLTGLYTRSFFFEYANRMYQKDPDTPMDAIVLDIDQFHSVNSLNGRDFGDQVLIALGEEIRAMLDGTQGIASRIEADRFLVYCEHVASYQELFNRLQNRLNECNRNANVRLRMGVMPWQAGVEPAKMFDRARIACGMARDHYRDHLVVFDDSMRQREVYKQRLLNDLRRALDEEEFEVYYQPKYNIQCDPPVLESAEALIRWHHPELGMISPADFIPLFERNGQIGLVDKFVWSQTARQIALWREKLGVTLPISVNLSRVDVFDPTLESTLDQLIRDNGLNCGSLKLEVTESAYSENADQVLTVIEKLRKKGHEIEMDDFGSGYSSLNMLSSMPIDVLKMDGAFIKNIEHREQDAQLVELIVDIAKRMKVKVVAECVETESQMLLLKELGCDLVQGYYFSPPLPAPEFEETILSPCL